MGAALVNVDDFEVPVVIVDDGGDVLLPVFFKLLLVLGTMDRVLWLSVLDIVLLVVVGQGHP